MKDDLELSRKTMPLSEISLEIGGCFLFGGMI
jgi:hypothetical protein